MYIYVEHRNGKAESRVRCQVTTALTAKASSMAGKDSTCVSWCRQIWVAVYAVTERLTAGITTAMLDMVTRMESTACAVIGRLKRTFGALCVVAAEEMVIAAIGEIIH